MSRFVRSSMIGVVAMTFAIALLARSTASLEGQSQAAPPTAAQLAPFLGDWLMSMSMGANEATFALSIKSDGGKPSAVITAEGQPTINVADVAAVGKGLVLKYTMQAMGTTIPSVLTLTPDGANLRANMAVMDGQYELSGSATKQVPGKPVRATGFGGGGGGQGSATSDATDFTPKPPYRARTPEEEAAGFMLPAGYRAELVAADPDVISPVVIEFDGNGRMYVVEMISYMIDASASREHEPISRIS